MARYHSVYGPPCTWNDGREKAPAAIARKVAVAKLTGNHEIEVWGDGNQTRSFIFLDDAIDGTLRLMASDCREPLNIGSAELVTIDQLAYLCAEIAGIEITIKHVPGPLGVRGRCSDNTLVKAVLGWQPSVSLRDGMARLYGWVERQVAGLG